jgi:hypothetical protein
MFNPKKIFILILLLASFIYCEAQNSNIPFQGIALDNKSAAISKKAIGIKISLLQGSESGTLKYEERHVPITDEFGLFQLDIGGGTRISQNTFAELDWTLQGYYIKVEIDPNGGTAYSSSSVTKMGTVPFAFFSEKAKTLANDINISI